MNVEGVFAQDLIQGLARFCQRQNNASRPGYFSARGDKDIPAIIFPEKLNVLGHVGIERFKRNDVVKVDYKHVVLVKKLCYKKAVSAIEIRPCHSPFTKGNWRFTARFGNVWSHQRGWAYPTHAAAVTCHRFVEWSLYLQYYQPSPMKQLFTLIMSCVLLPAFATDPEVDSTQVFLDSIESTFHYQEGDIHFDNNVGILKVPQGFRYLDAEQTRFVIHDLWGNPGGDGTMGMIVPSNIPITSAESWAFIITYDEMGYVKDDDAGDIDYDDMLIDMQEETAEENKEREAAGYEPISIIGWASKPFYDKNRKVLHWAKELNFGGSDVHTLNYNVRVLGRKGVLVLNAVASMDALPTVQQNIDPVLNAFQYAEGYQYDDFNPELDKVAAWTVGGLVAGKVLAKAGIFALLLKNIKLIGIAIIGMVTAVIKWFRRKTEPPTVREFPADNQG